MKLVGQVHNGFLVTCSKCNGNVNLQFPVESASDYSYTPQLCQCGHIMHHNEIVSARKVPVKNWICPDCSCYNVKDLKIRQFSIAGPASDLQEISNFTEEAEETKLLCKNCKREYKQFTIMTSEHAVLLGVGKND